MNSSTLTFIYAYPFDRDRRTLFEGKGLLYPSMEEVQTVLKHWEILWNEKEKKHNIISVLTEMTGRVPERNLECFVFGAGFQTMSTPFLLPVMNKAKKQWTDEKFIEIIIHELLHIFLVTNNTKYWDEVRSKYADETPLCRNHILLYALLYEIYQTLFNTEPSDFTRDNVIEGYARAVQIVREIGYKKLIAEYRTFI